MGTQSKQAPGADAGAALVVVDRADFLRAAQVASIVDTKNTIPILSNMTVVASGDELALTATDLDISVRVVVPARCEGLPLSTTVAAKRLASLVAASDEGCQISMKLAAGGRDIEVRAPGSKFKMPVLPLEDFPMMAFSSGEQSFTIAAKLLAAVLVRTSDSESDEVARYYLCGTLLASVEGKLRAVATNGHMMSEVVVDDAPGDWPPVILPSKLTALLVRLLKEGEDDVCVTLDERGGRISFEWGAWTIHSKLIEGQFPDWRRVIPSARTDRRVIVDSAALQRAISRTSQMSAEKTRSVVVSLDTDRLTVTCSSPDIGEAEEEVAATCPISGFRMRVNATYLRDIAAAASGDSVAFDFGEENGPVRVGPTAGDDFVGVLMPMRV